MKLALFIARRYLLSKKSVNAINIISGISMLGILVSSAALITILSAFNGLEGLILTHYSSYSADIRIEPASGKTFDPSSADINTVKRRRDLVSFDEVLQEKVLLRYGNRQSIALMKGVEAESSGLGTDSLLWDGDFRLQDDGGDYAIIGADLYGQLNLGGQSIPESVTVYVPRKGAQVSINPADEFNYKEIEISGIFRPAQQFDQTLLVPLSFSRTLLNEAQEVSAIEIRLENPNQADALHKELKSQLGDRFQIKNRAQQNPDLYKLLNSEKWGVFAILLFVLLIASFNIVGSLSMLVIDKKQDIAILNAMGAGKGLIQAIFFSEGILISMLGCIFGLLMGLLICLIQQYWGIVRLSASNTITEFYPVQVKADDLLVVLGTVAVVSTLASWVSARLSVRNTATQLKSVAD